MPDKKDPENDDPDEAPETPPDEPQPAPIQDPPPEPTQVPYVMGGHDGAPAGELMP